MFDVDKTLECLLRGTSMSDEQIRVIREKIEEVNKEGRTLRIKFGMDPSAPDLHLGHAVALRKIKQLQDLGHTAVIIIGDFTGAIGDPSGKSKTRKQLSKEEVEKNSQTYFEQVFRIIDRDKTELYYNSEWYNRITFREIIDLTSKVTVARMLERDDFENRYKSNKPIGLHEFFYPLMQAYDSVVVNADIEMGGTDQTFNVMMGIKIQKAYGKKPQVPLFVPLLVGIDGKEKMSKSLENYVGITEDANEAFVKIMKLDDNSIITYFELATDVDKDTIDNIKANMESGDLNPKDAKEILATEILSLYHPKDVVEAARRNFKVIYQGADVEETDGLPELFFGEEHLLSNGEYSLVQCLYDSNSFNSKADIRRLINQGGVRINNLQVRETTFVPEENSIVRAGRDHLYILKDKCKCLGGKPVIASR